MAVPLDPPMPPQTAAALLDLLARSQLFADSILRQIQDQSAPFLDQTATEYASALVHKRVLTSWQARELLKGHWAFYAGTFRLLERLGVTSSGAMFIAEQTGPQRLVLLRLLPIPAELSVSSKVTPVRPSHEIPYLLRCLDIQEHGQLRLEAYEFQEATPLAWALKMSVESQRPNTQQRAALVRQFAETIDRALDADIDGLTLECTLINKRGELKFLWRSPDVLRCNQTDETGLPLNSDRLRRAMVAIHRFADAIGGEESIAGCQTPGEVCYELTSDVVPWEPQVEMEAPKFLFGAINRYLRRGPAARVVETLGNELQYHPTLLGRTDPQFCLANNAPTPRKEPVKAPVIVDERSHPSDSSRLVLADVPEITPVDGWSPRPPFSRQTLIRRSRTSIKSRWMLLMLGGMTAMVLWQWFWQGMTRQAAATTNPEPKSPAPSVPPHLPSLDQ